jgi:hypothetical protein
MQRLTLCLTILAMWSPPTFAESPADLTTIPPDLQNPPIVEDTPAPGHMVLQRLPANAGTGLAHALYLPTDWKPGNRYPVLVEYRGNMATVRGGGALGYGLSGGKGFIWAILPFVSPDHSTDLDKWWGDLDATVAYAKEAVPLICSRWGGDPKRVILTGHSRGAIACNYIGLHDDEIARHWCGMIAMSHYDDAHTAWGMTPEEQRRAPERLVRLGQTPQFICGEYQARKLGGTDKKILETVRAQGLSTFAVAREALGLVALTELEGTRRFVAEHHPRGRFTIVDLPYVNHTADLVLRDVPERRQLREWLQRFVAEN